MTQSAPGSDGRSGPLERATQLLDSLRDRDLDGVLDCFDLGPDVYVYPEGPRWTTRGGDRIRLGWQGYFKAPIRLRGWSWAEGPEVHQSGDLALVAGVVDCQFECAGQPRELKMRMTWVQRRTDGVWRILHEHGSQPLGDPYGTGDWLETPDPAASSAQA